MSQSRRKSATRMGVEPVRCGATPVVLLVWRCHCIACTGSLADHRLGCWYRGSRHHDQR